MRLADRGIFATPVARGMILAAIPTHLALGVLLAAAAMRSERRVRLA